MSIAGYDKKRDLMGARRSSKDRPYVQIGDPVSGPAVLDTPQLVAEEQGYKSLTQEAPSLTGQVSPKASTAAVILAGGSGERLGNPEGKQLLELLGKPVLTWSAETFDAVADVGLIVIVCPEERAEEYCRCAIDPFPFVTPIVLASAGTIRQESAFSGIEMVPESYEFIAIHDGARPLVTPDLVRHAISAVKGNLDADGVVIGHPAVDTLKVISGSSIIGTPDRSAFWIAQTPQIFRSEVIRQGHAAALADGFVGTDDSALVERLGGTVVLVEGPRDNIKVTVPEDLGPIEAALASRLNKAF